jgi:hypothetical protein
MDMDFAIGPEGSHKVAKGLYVLIHVEGTHIGIGA